jgi:hypothetical protein
MTQHSATIQSDAMSEPQSSYCSVQAKHDMVGMLRSSSRAQNHSGYAPNVTPEEQGHNYGGHRKVKALAEDDWLNERSNHGVADALRCMMYIRTRMRHQGARSVRCQYSASAAGMSQCCPS